MHVDGTKSLKYQISASPSDLPAEQSDNPSWQSQLPLREKLFRWSREQDGDRWWGQSFLAIRLQPGFTKVLVLL